MSLSASDKVIVNGELVDNILNQLADYDVDRSSRAALAKLAVTSKNISELALDVLWRHQTNLLPLVRLLPADQWCVQNEHVVHGDTVAQSDYEEEEEEEEEEERVANPDDENETIHVIKFNRPLEDEDTSRFDHYRTKIRQLQPYSLRGWVYVVHPDALKALNQRYQYLLPGLKDLLLDLDHCYAQLSGPYIQVLLGPSITSIIINTNTDFQTSQSLALLLSKVERHAPNAKALGLRGFEKLDPSSFESLLRRFQNLRELGCSSLQLSVTELQNIGRLRLLECLSFDRSKLLPSDQNTAAAGSLFPSLKRLNVQVATWAQLQCFLNPQQMLQQLDVQRSGLQGQLPDANEDVTSFNRVIEQIGSYPNFPKTLTHLTLVDFELITGTSETESIEYMHSLDLSPLLALQALTSVNISGPCVMLLGDSWIQRASESWKTLRSLAITANRTIANVTPTLTLSGIVPLIRNCPHLCSLNFTAQWEPFDLLPILQAATFNTAITALSHSYASLGSTHDGQAAKLYHCLMTLFPRLKQIRNYQASGDAAVWLELEHLVNGKPAEDPRSLLSYRFDQMLYYHSLTLRKKEIN